MNYFVSLDGAAASQSFGCLSMLLLLATYSLATLYSVQCTLVSGDTAIYLPIVIAPHNNNACKVKKDRNPGFSLCWYVYIMMMIINIKLSLIKISHTIVVLYCR